eukprot:1186964-Amphidinium_carterae.1
MTLFLQRVQATRTNASATHEFSGKNSFRLSALVNMVTAREAIAIINPHDCLPACFASSFMLEASQLGGLVQWADMTCLLESTQAHALAPKSSTKTAGDAFVGACLLLS